MAWIELTVMRGREDGTVNETTLRAAAALGGIVAGTAFIALLSLALPAQPDAVSAGGILLDRASPLRSPSRTPCGCCSPRA